MIEEVVKITCAQIYLIQINESKQIQMIRSNHAEKMEILTGKMQNMKKNNQTKKKAFILKVSLFKKDIILPKRKLNCPKF